MKIRTWYNTTQDKYYTDYRQPILDYEPGHINGQGHILISNIYFFDNKVFFSREARENFIDRRALKNKVKNRIIDFIKKI